jgi:predicted ATPase/DNA-binding winged helix-turn-helix (wHTH) protein
VADRTTAVTERAISFGPFRLFPAQQLLLEGEAPVRLGSRAFDILIALVESPGELVSKTDLSARVWPDTLVDENTLRVHVAGLRKALGDGQPGRRYLANVPGRGYRFVAPIELSGLGEPSPHTSQPQDRTHNLPLSQARTVGRSAVLETLIDQLPERRFITIVGTGGIGKTTVAVALAEALLPAYEDGIRFADLAPVEDPQFVSNALGNALGLAVHLDNARLIDFVKNKRMLIVLDSCEHVVEAAASLAEQLLAGAPGVHILATSREPLRAEGERVHRLQPLESPDTSMNLTAAEALTSPAVRLFVERAAASMDGFELNDADAPVVSDICRKLGGIALAIELAAARVDAFGIRQLSVLLDDQFRVLKQGKRTAQPRHQSLTAALDWSYEFLPDGERVVLRRLSVFAGAFTLESAIAVVGGDSTDVVEGVANLVAKSLVSADVSGAIVQYRLLDTTRAYGKQKLVEAGESEAYARRHAQHHLAWFERAEIDWQTLAMEQWLEGYGRSIDDIRSALAWAFSPNGDPSVGIKITAASIPLWLEHSLVHECRERVERALASQAAQPAHDERDELKLLLALEIALRFASRRLYEHENLLARALALAESLGNNEARGQALYDWAIRRFHVGDYRGMLTYAEKCRAVASEDNNALLRIMGDGMVGYAMYYLGDYRTARRYIDPIVNHAVPDNQNWLLSQRLAVRLPLSNILWLQGFPDQAIACARLALDEANATNNALVLNNILAVAACPIALLVGDLAEAERSIAKLQECTKKYAFTVWAPVSSYFKGALLSAHGDVAGLAVLRTALHQLRNVNFVRWYAPCLETLARGLGAAGQVDEAHAAIDEALERSNRDEERWCQPELLRIKGELLQLDRPANAAGTAEGHFQQALDEARRQEALSWELRAATSLARLWRDDGKIAEAVGLLSGVYDRFTEGFDTADLKAARALLGEMRGAAEAS